MSQTTSTTTPADSTANRPVEGTSRLSNGAIPLAIVLVIIVAAQARRNHRRRLRREEEAENTPPSPPA